MGKFDSTYLLSPSRAAKLMGISVNTLHNLIAEGKIKALKIKSRIKIPYGNLIDFILDNTLEVKKVNGRTLTKYHNRKTTKKSGGVDAKEILNNIIGVSHGDSH